MGGENDSEAKEKLRVTVLVALPISYATVAKSLRSKEWSASGRFRAINGAGLVTGKAIRFEARLGVQL